MLKDLATDSALAERLLHLPQLGPMRFKKLLEACDGSLHILPAAPKALWEGVAGLGETAFTAFQELLGRSWVPPAQPMESRFVYQQEAAFPHALRQLSDTPIGLYAAGAWEHLNRPCVAIVGSRNSTVYGRKMAQQIAFELAKAGCCIVSGLALGIDGAAHQGALEAGGATAAVLGCGLDVLYPPEHKELYARILQSGLLLSEFPPGRRADKQTFPRRNRLISGLSRGVVVIESDLHGGSMITARFAADQGRPVYALPGRVDQPSSSGCHLLIREGATLITQAADILEDLGWGRSTTAGPQQLPLIPALDLQALPQEARHILLAMEPGEPYCADALSQSLCLPAATVSAHLMLLEIKRALFKRLDGTFERRL